MTAFTVMITLDADDSEHAAELVGGWTVTPGVTVMSVVGTFDVTGGLPVVADGSGRLALPTNSAPPPA